MSDSATSRMQQLQKSCEENALNIEQLRVRRENNEKIIRELQSTLPPATVLASLQHELAIHKLKSGSSHP